MTLTKEEFIATFSQKFKEQKLKTKVTNFINMNTATIEQKLLFSKELNENRVKVNKIIGKNGEEQYIMFTVEELEDFDRITMYLVSPLLLSKLLGEVEVEEETVEYTHHKELFITPHVDLSKSYSKLGTVCLMEDGTYATVLPNGQIIQ